MSSSNDQISESLKKNIAELVLKKQNLTDIKKDIKINPDNRYTQRKELGKETKELESLICEEMNDGDEVLVGRRRFKKQRIDNPKYNKDAVIAFLDSNEISVETYERESKVEKVSLKAISKNDYKWYIQWLLTIF